MKRGVVLSNPVTSPRKTEAVGVSNSISGHGQKLVYSPHKDGTTKNDLRNSSSNFSPSYHKQCDDANSSPLTPLQTECMTLIRFKQYKSCEAIAHFELSSQLVDFQKVNNTSSTYSVDKKRSALIANKANTLAITMEIIADCSFNTDQVRRALHFYRQALFYRRIASNSCAHTNLRNDRVVHSPSEAILRVKECDCLSSMGDLSEAVSVLESAFRSHSPYRTLDVCMTLGNLYLTIGKKKEAISAYMDALKQSPFAIEAVEKLAVLGVNKEDVLMVVNGVVHAKVPSVGFKTIQNRVQNKENRDLDPINRVGYVHSTMQKSQQVQQGSVVESIASPSSQHLPIIQLVSVHFDSFSTNIKTAENILKSLEKTYPNNIYLLLNHANLQLKSKDRHGAKLTLEKVRMLDEFNLEHMDKLVALMVSSPKTTKNKRKIDVDDQILVALNRMCHSMLETNSARPEPWVALAIYHRMKEDTASSLQFIDKAISCCPSYAFAHYLQGSILLSDRKPDQAVVSFQKANELSGDIDSYEGLVEGYLASDMLREALFSAKEAINLWPKDPRALSLIGLTLSYSLKGSKRGPSNRDVEEKAKLALRKALKLDPGAPRSLFALVEIYLKSKEYEDCVEILQSAIESSSDGIIGDCSCIWSSLNVTHLQPLSFYCSGAAVRDGKDVLYTKLGIAQTLNNNFIDASKSLHMALSLNPYNKDARRAYAQLEKIITGEEIGLNESDDEKDNSWDKRDDDSESEY